MTLSFPLLMGFSYLSFLSLPEIRDAFYLLVFLIQLFIKPFCQHESLLGKEIPHPCAESLG